MVRLDLDKIGQSESGEYIYFDLQDLEQRLRRMERMYQVHDAFSLRFKITLQLKGMANNLYLHRIKRDPDYLQSRLDDYDRADVEF